jgi:hypothetical protein
MEVALAAGEDPSANRAMDREELRDNGDVEPSAATRRLIEKKEDLTAENRETGAGEGIRTLDPNLGKVVLYP